GKAGLERSKLIAIHPGVEVEAVTVAGKGAWYRVKISNLSDRNEAERLLREFKARNYDPMLVKQ
ncbi:MAG: SPOR domain-containing protein, partial [Deltaproteobacteria bacterium]|nr:SPOR domain-containing protein [Deltaproteobacteria bacterium]